MQGPRFGDSQAKTALLQEAKNLFPGTPRGCSSQNKPGPNHLELIRNSVSQAPPPVILIQCIWGRAEICILKAPQSDRDAGCGAAQVKQQ